MNRITPRGKKPTRTEQAADALLSAQAEASNSGHACIVAMHEKNHADLMKPVEGSTEIILGEVVPLPAVWKDDDDFDYTEALAIDVVRDTLLQNPDTVAIDASMERTRILHKAGALEIGIDAAHSIQARNSLEKMLAHQMAVCHSKAMEIMTTAADYPKGREDLEIKRLNLAARLMDTYQKGMDTLTRTRNAGKQTITVKQVHVTGGQNVIADNVTTKGGGYRGGE